MPATTSWTSAEILAQTAHLRATSAGLIAAATRACTASQAVCQRYQHARAGRLVARSPSVAPDTDDTPVELLLQALADIEARTGRAAAEAIAREPAFDETTIDLAVDRAITRATREWTPDELRALIDSLHALAQELHRARMASRPPARSDARFRPPLS